MVDRELEVYCTTMCQRVQSSESRIVAVGYGGLVTWKRKNEYSFVLLNHLYEVLYDRS